MTGSQIPLVPVRVRSFFENALIDAQSASVVAYFRLVDWEANILRLMLVDWEAHILRLMGAVAAILRCVHFAFPSVAVSVNAGRGRRTPQGTGDVSAIIDEGALAPGVRPCHSTKHGLHSVSAVDVAMGIVV